MDITFEFFNHIYEKSECDEVKVIGKDVIQEGKAYHLLGMTRKNKEVTVYVLEWNETMDEEVDEDIEEAPETEAPKTEDAPASEEAEEAIESVVSEEESVPETEEGTPEPAEEAPEPEEAEQETVEEPEPEEGGAHRLPGERAHGRRCQSRPPAPPVPQLGAAGRLSPQAGLPALPQHRCQIFPQR